jgi:hypothetical protein
MYVFSIYFKWLKFLQTLIVGHLLFNKYVDNKNIYFIQTKNKYE